MTTKILNIMFQPCLMNVKYSLDLKPEKNTQTIRNNVHFRTHLLQKRSVLTWVKIPIQDYIQLIFNIL